MSDIRAYQTPAGAVRGDEPQLGGIRDDQVLVSGATFYGWIYRSELIERE